MASELSFDELVGMICNKLSTRNGEWIAEQAQVILDRTVAYEGEAGVFRIAESGNRAFYGLLDDLKTALAKSSAEDLATTAQSILNRAVTYRSDGVFVLA